MTTYALRANPAITAGAVAATLGRYFKLYRHREPHYQAVMLGSLRNLWQEHHARLLDIGGGTGVIAQCIAELFPVGTVTSVDVADRFREGLTIDTCVYDGIRLPFANGLYDAATINNVVHHIPPAMRVELFRDMARVVDGPLYIKDHATTGRIDDTLLMMLDMIGNVAFAGQVSAQYLSMDAWYALAAASGYRIVVVGSGGYRCGAMALAFPNRLEITMRWERA